MTWPAALSTRECPQAPMALTIFVWVFFMNLMD